jgi:hypothetical protein
MNAEPAHDDALAAATGAALLGSIGKTLHAWSLAAALAAILILGLKPGGVYSAALLTASLVAALAQAYFAARCAFDAAVFAALRGDSAQYAGFDRLLERWQLRAANASTRPVAERVQGALRLLRRQAYSLCVQIALLTAGLIVITGYGA